VANRKTSQAQIAKIRFLSTTSLNLEKTQSIVALQCYHQGEFLHNY